MPIKSDDAEEEEMDDTLEGPLIRFKEWYNNGIDTTAFQRKFVSLLYGINLFTLLI